MVDLRLAEAREIPICPCFQRHLLSPKVPPLFDCLISRKEIKTPAGGKNSARGGPNRKPFASYLSRKTIRKNFYIRFAPESDFKSDVR
jgi:hypothetical protein